MSLRRDYIMEHKPITIASFPAIVLTNNQIQNHSKRNVENINTLNGASEYSGILYHFVSKVAIA